MTINVPGQIAVNVNRIDITITSIMPVKWFFVVSSCHRVRSLIGMVLTKIHIWFIAAHHSCALQVFDSFLCIEV